MESTGYAAAAQPTQLKVTLQPFQRQTLQWMLDREHLPGGEIRREVHQAAVVGGPLIVQLIDRLVRVRIIGLGLGLGFGLGLGSLGLGLVLG